MNDENKKDNAINDRCKRLQLLCDQASVVSVTSLLHTAVTHVGNDNLSLSKTNCNDVIIIVSKTLYSTPSCKGIFRKSERPTTVQVKELV